MPPKACLQLVYATIQSHSQKPSRRIKYIQTFKSKEAFQLALVVKSVHDQGFQYKLNISTKSRFEAIYYQDNCTRCILVRLLKSIVFSMFENLLTNTLFFQHN